MEQEKELFLNNLIRYASVISIDKEDVKFAREAEKPFMEIFVGEGKKRVENALACMKERLDSKNVNRVVFTIVTDSNAELEIVGMNEIHSFMKFLPAGISLAWGLRTDDSLSDHSCKVILTATINN